MRVNDIYFMVLLGYGYGYGLWLVYGTLTNSTEKNIFWNNVVVHLDIHIIVTQFLELFLQQKFKGYVSTSWIWAAKP